MSRQPEAKALVVAALQRPCVTLLTSGPPFLACGLKGLRLSLVKDYSVRTRFNAHSPLH